MQSLNFPNYPFRLRTVDHKPQVFDSIRKKWVALTPEEWVRQHFVQYLVTEKEYPASLIAIEKPLEVNGLKKRCDILAHDRRARPFLLVECKAPEVSITQETFDQAARYNMRLGVDLIAVTNGLVHFCCRVDHATHSYQFLPSLPHFPAE